jgi:hypothetical protein
MPRTRNRTRTIAAAGFLAAASLFLTACNSDDTAGGSGGGSGKDSKADSGSASEGGKSNGGNGSGGKGTGGGKRVLSGKVVYLAPGKFTVGDQAFFVADDTKIQGGEICSDPETPGPETCTLKNLEAASKGSGVNAQVTMKKGVALKVIGGPGEGSGTSGGNGGTSGGNSGGGNSGGTSAGNSGGGSSADGTVSGKLSFLAPGKLKAGDRAFFVAEDTYIQGGEICGDPETSEAEKCTPEDLDKAAKDGNLKVTVTIKKGIADRVVQS